MIGQTLSHFKITAKLGEGGMGEVYRAGDTKLGREVAIKVLPAEVTADPERLARFEREARVLASFSHPNIAGIHQVELVEDVHFLVMELAEGENLAERLARGPLPIDVCLALALQVAQAIEAAHEKGIVHRDLKPANVMVSDGGTAKVLDFGLAKAWEVESGASDSLSMSPTLTAQMTQAGVLLGTVAYMSPEQARGQEVDKQTDIWAFGCLLYEMLSARRAFSGSTTTDVLAAIVGNEPDWDALPEATPTAVRRLLHRTLAKDPDQRLRDIGDAELDLIEAQATPKDDPAERAARPAAGGRLGLLFAGLALGLALGMILMMWVETSPDPEAREAKPAIRGVVELADEANLAYGSAMIGFDNPLLTLSPDGRWLVYVGQLDSGSILYRHDLTRFEKAEPIAGTEGAIHAFFSPDGNAVGFFTNQRLKRVSLQGENLQTLATVRAPVRGVWLQDDTILFGNQEGNAVTRVPANGGTAEETATESATLSDALPDGTRVLASSWGGRGINADYADVWLIDLDSGEQRIVLKRGYDARYLPTGHLLFARAGSLLAIAFDPVSGTVSGEPITVISDVGTDSLFSQSQFAVSANGTLAYIPGGQQSLGRLAWVDRSGEEGRLDAEAQLYGMLDIDPEERRLAVHVGDVTDFIWIFDLDRREGRPLHGARPGGWPSWSYSGQQLAFIRENGETDTSSVMVSDPSSSSKPSEWLEMGSMQTSVGGWSPDDRALSVLDWGALAFTVLETGSERPDDDDIEWIRGWGTAFSPDGKWLAYGTQETGDWEIFVRSWPSGEVIHQISTSGGIEPRWCPCGELFYRTGNIFWSVEIQTEPELVWQPATVAFETDFIDTPGMSFDVSSDGNRLYVVKQANPEIADRIHVVSNWANELISLVPTD